MRGKPLNSHLSPPPPSVHLDSSLPPSVSKASNTGSPTWTPVPERKKGMCSFPIFKSMFGKEITTVQTSATTKMTTNYQTTAHCSGRIKSFIILCLSHVFADIKQHTHAPTSPSVCFIVSPTGLQLTQDLRQSS